MQKLPLEIQTLYAELMEQLVAVEAQRSIGSVSGCFVTKSVKGESYYYFQYSDPGGLQRQSYIGKKHPILDKIVDLYQNENITFKADIAQKHRLCALLRTGGAFVTDSASARVLKSLAEGGVFHVGGVLIGTQAFGILGNLLGMRWERSALRKHDIDIAAELGIGVVVPDIQTDVPKVLEALETGFLPVPLLNPKNPSTSFKVRGKALRLDLLTPEKKAKGSDPVSIKRFNAAARPLPFLDYLIKEPARATVVNGGGILVNVPAPARFAFHKLIIAQERDVSTHDKTEKDLLQAAQLLSVMAEERAGDLMLASDEIKARGGGWVKRVRKGLSMMKRLDQAAFDRTSSLLG